ncbi:GT4 family glycosyltransferase PelF [Caminibacter pacificus]
MERIKVVWTGEGTYPYVTGGVSTWAHILISELRNIDFVLMPIQMNPYMTLKYKLPQNVIDTIGVPLWGTQEPLEYVKNISFSKMYKNKIITKKSKDLSKIEPLMISLLEHIYGIKEDLDSLADYLFDFHEYFQKYDYYETFKKQEIWEIYRDFLLEYFKDKKDVPSVYDMIEGLRYIYRFFITLLPEIPKAAIYHSSAAAFCGLPCIVAKKKYGSKFILTEHGIYIREQYLFASRNKLPLHTKKFLMGLISTVSKLNYHFADVVAPVCRFNTRWEKKWGGVDDDKIDVIYNGIDIYKFKKLPVEKKHKKTVVMVARIDPLKDIETYLRVAKIVTDKDNDVVFKLYGPVSDEEYYKKCLKLHEELGLNEKFIFAGPISAPQNAYNEGDVVVLTSISEAFPFAVIEAMACEKVVVASDVGGTKEVLEGYGYVVKPKDYQEFAEKILYVLQNPKIAQELGFEARQRIIDGFTIEDMTANYENLYKKMYMEYKNG